MKNGSWIEIKIADLFASMSTGDWGQMPTLNSSIPVIRSTNFQNNGFLDLTDVVYRAISKERLSSRTVNKGDILFEKSGGGPMQPAGRIVYSETDFQGTASNFIEIGKVKSNYDNKFVFYLLHSLYLNGLVLKYQQQTTGIINFKIKEYFKEVVKVPSEKKEQAKIAEVLATIDHAIAQTEALIAKHQRIKTGLMQDLLTRGIDEHGQLRDPSTHRFKSTPLGMIPVDWEVVELGNTEYFRLATGGTPSTSVNEFWEKGTIPWMSSGEVHKKEIYDTETYITEKGYANSNARYYPPESIVMALAGQGKTRGTVAITKIELTSNQSIAAIIPNKKFVSPYFVFWYLDRKYEDLRSVSSGAGRAGLSLRILSEYKIALPKIDEQIIIAERIQAINQQILQHRSARDKNGSLKQGLMQDLLSGRVSVKVLMNMEGI